MKEIKPNDGVATDDFTSTNSVLFPEIAGLLEKPLDSDGD